MWSNGATVEHGKPRLLLVTPPQAGTYSVTVTATDLAGNFATATGTITLTKGARAALDCWRRADSGEAHDTTQRAQSEPAMARLMRDWRALDPEQRLAGGAALALFVTMLLPVVPAERRRQRAPDDAAAEPEPERVPVFSFVEAAVLLVAVAVLTCCSRAPRGASSISRAATARS